VFEYIVKAYALNAISLYTEVYHSCIIFSILRQVIAIIDRFIANKSIFLDFFAINNVDFHQAFFKTHSFKP